MMDLSSSSSSCDEEEGIPETPHKFENELEELDDSSSSSGSEDGSQPKSLYHVHKRFHVPSKYKRNVIPNQSAEESTTLNPYGDSDAQRAPSHQTDPLPGDPTEQMDTLVSTDVGIIGQTPDSTSQREVTPLNSEDSEYLTGAIDITAEPATLETTKQPLGEQVEIKSIANEDSSPPIPPRRDDTQQKPLLPPRPLSTRSVTTVEIPETKMSDGEAEDQKESEESTKLRDEKNNLADNTEDKQPPVLPPRSVSMQVSITKSSCQPPPVPPKPTSRQSAPEATERLEEKEANIESTQTETSIIKETQDVDAEAQKEDAHTARSESFDVAMDIAKDEETEIKRKLDGTDDDTGSLQTNECPRDSIIISDTMMADMSIYSTMPPESFVMVNSENDPTKDGDEEKSSDTENEEGNVPKSNTMLEEQKYGDEDIEIQTWEVKNNIECLEKRENMSPEPEKAPEPNEDIFETPNASMSEEDETYSESMENVQEIREVCDAKEESDHGTDTVMEGGTEKVIEICRKTHETAPSDSENVSIDMPKSTGAVNHPFGESFVVIGKGTHKFESMSSTISESEIDENMKMSQLEVDLSKSAVENAEQESDLVSVKDRRSLFENLVSGNKNKPVQLTKKCKIRLSEEMQKDAEHADIVSEDKQSPETIVNPEKTLESSASSKSMDASSSGSSIIVLSRENSQKTETDEMEEKNNNKETESSETLAQVENDSFIKIEVPAASLGDVDEHDDVPPVVGPKSLIVLESLTSLQLEMQKERPEVPPRSQQTGSGNQGDKIMNLKLQYGIDQTSVTVKDTTMMSHDYCSASNEMHTTETQDYEKTAVRDHEIQRSPERDRNNPSPLPTSHYHEIRTTPERDRNNRSPLLTTPDNLSQQSEFQGVATPPHVQGQNLLSPQDAWQQQQRWFWEQQQFLRGYPRFPRQNYPAMYNQAYGSPFVPPSMPPYQPMPNTPSRQTQSMNREGSPGVEQTQHTSTDMGHQSVDNLPKPEEVVEGNTSRQKVHAQKHEEVVEGNTSRQKVHAQKHEEVVKGNTSRQKVHPQKHEVAVEENISRQKVQAERHERVVKQEKVAEVKAAKEEKTVERKVAQQEKVVEEMSAKQRKVKGKKPQKQPSAKDSPSSLKKDVQTKQEVIHHPRASPRRAKQDVQRVKSQADTPIPKPCHHAEPGILSSLDAKSEHKLETPEVKEEQEHYLYAKDINPVSSSENLANYFEVGSNADVIKEKLLINPNKATALVVVKGTPDMNRLRERIQAKPIDGHKPSVYEVPPPTRIAVSSEMEIKSKDGLAYYFELPRNGGGDLASDDVEEAEDGSCYILHFKDSKVVQSLCEMDKTHKCDGVLLRVSPYYTCEAGCIWDTSLHLIPIPAPVTVKLTYRHSNFLQRECCEELRTSIKEKHCTLTFDNQSVHMLCTMIQSTPGIRNLVKTWADDVRGHFEAYMNEHVKERNIAISESVWNDLLKFFNSEEFTSTMLVTSIDNDKRVLTLLGFPADVDRKVEELQKKEEEIDKILRRTKESKKLPSAQKVQLLDSMQVFESLREKFPEVEIFSGDSEVVVEGLPDDINSVFLEIFQEADKIETYDFPHDYSSDCVYFVNNRPKVVSELNHMIQKKGLKAEWKMAEKELIVYVVSKETADEVEDTIYSAIVEKRVKHVPKAVEVFRTDKWKVLCGDIAEEYENQVGFEQLKRENVILVFGFKNEVSVVEKMIIDFIEENLIIEEAIPCGSIEMKFMKMHAKNEILDISNKFHKQKVKVKLNEKDGKIEVSGTNEGVKNLKLELNRLIKSVIKETHKIEKVAVWDVFQSEKEKGTLESIEKSTGCIIQLPDAFDTYQLASDDADAQRYSPGASAGPDSDDDVFDVNPTAPIPPSVFKAKNGVKISLVKGELGKQSGDVLVVSTSPSLNLSSGAAGRSILNEGGNELQLQCKRTYPKEIELGELAVVKACGSLECQDVYLTALPSWKDHTSAKQILQNFMAACLDTANKAKKSSILFCALGTGQLKYPTDLVAMMMFQAVIDFDASNPNTSLKDVQFVLYQKDTPTIKVFEEEERMLIAGSGTRPTHDIQIGPVKVELAIENLAEQRVDGILCTTSATMDLSRSGACQALVRAGGPTLQAECQTKYNNTLGPGQIVDIGGGKLACKSVFLTLLPGYTPGESEQTLKNVIQTCLNLAQAKKYTSLATPALGTGFLKYPKQDACRWMYEAVTEFTTKNPSTCVKTVRFIMYAKDHALIQAFKGYVVQQQGKMPKLGRTLRQASNRQDRKLDHNPSIKQSSQATLSGDVKQPKFNATSDGVQIREVVLKVYKEDILKEKSDAIVSSVGKPCTFQGAVAQTLLKKCPGLKDECEQKHNVDKINKNGILVTKCAGLKAGNIIHVQFEEYLAGWKKKMLKCLEKANKRKWSSLSFPVLGSGSGFTTFDPACIAEVLFDAINEFTSNSYQRIHTKDVRLVVYKGTPAMYDPIMKALHKKAQSAAEAQTMGRLKRFVKIGAAGAGFVKQGVMEHVFGSKKGVLSPEERKTLTETTSSLELNIYSDKKEKIDKCKTVLEAQLEKAYIMLKIDTYQEIIKTLMDKELKQLDDVNAFADIKIDRKAGIITIRGPFKQADDARSELVNKLRYIEKERNAIEEAETLYKAIIWHHEDITQTGIDLVPYDKISNSNIERAYKNNEKHVVLPFTDGPVIIDFQKLVEYPKADESDQVKVLRKDMIKAASGALPDEWAAMKDNENIKLVTLAATDPAYKTAEQRFVKEVQTGSYANRIPWDKSKLKVTKIERIQNKALYHQYIAKKKQIEGRNRSLPPNMPIEREVWHGTTQDSVSSIQMHGFNRSYCGKNGIWFGAGVYFAGDASYSARGWLSGANAGATGVKGYVFLVKALTGQFCKGTNDMRFLPPVDPAKPLELYDSAVDNIQNPLEFVIFHDTQAYPEYIISFTA